MTPELKTRERIIRKTWTDWKFNLPIWKNGLQVINNPVYSLKLNHKVNVISFLLKTNFSVRLIFNNKSVIVEEKKISNSFPLLRSASDQKASELINNITGTNLWNFKWSFGQIWPEQASDKYRNVPIGRTRTNCDIQSQVFGSHDWQIDLLWSRQYYQIKASFLQWLPRSKLVFATNYTSSLSFKK